MSANNQSTVIDDNFDQIDAFIEAAIDVDAVIDMSYFIKNAKTPEALLVLMQSIFSTDDVIPSNRRHLLSPAQLIEEKNGTCWDFTEFERVWFRRNYPGKFKILYIAAAGDDRKSSHTFLLYYSMNDVTWFEFSWTNQQGIHRYSSESDAIADIAKKFKIANSVTEYTIRHLIEVPVHGTSMTKFTSYIDNQPEIVINNSKQELTADDYVPVFGVIKSYSHDLLRVDGTEKDEHEQGSMKFDKLLKKLTRGDNYSHALVALDSTLSKMYSFEDSGFVIDDINTNPSWLGTKSIYVTVMFVTKDEHETMEAYLAYLEENVDDTAYGMSNLLTMMIGKPVKQDKRFVCSTLTGFILSMGNRKNLQRDYSRLRPEDITLLPRAFYVDTFTDARDFRLRHAEFLEKISALKTEYWEEIDDYNNHLPKLLLRDNMHKLKTIDRIFNWIISRI